MKLLAITNRFNFISILFLFIAGGFVLFIFIRYHLNQELDEELNTEKVHITEALHNIDSISDPSHILSDNLIITKVLNLIETRPTLFDTLIYDNVEQEVIPFRALKFQASSRHANYDIIIKKSEIETLDLILSIAISLMVIFGLIGIIMVIVNYFFSKKLWSPFLTVIESIDKLNINNLNKDFTVPETKITEFKQLNSALTRMIRRITQDFEKIKEFTENAAHEIQTPLSVITTKLESLIQSTDLKEENAQLIYQALENTTRLSKLNKTLLLLTKIGNRQFDNKQPIRFSMVIERHFEDYKELISEKKLQCTFDISKDFVCEMHPALADILISNLLNNSINHNTSGGAISVTLHEDGMDFSNTGEAPDVPLEELFNRFKKGTNQPGHMGLGLSIIKEIVETNDLRITYQYNNTIHRISIQKVN